jgi:hypothetical protein
MKVLGYDDLKPQKGHQLSRMSISKAACAA